MSEIPSFGAWLKRRRKALDLTQDALARLVGCSVVSIRKFEGDTQRPSRQLAERLAAQLQIPPDQRATFVQFARQGLDAAPPELPLPAEVQLSSAAVSQPLSEPPSHNLPIPPTQLIGRETELNTLGALLRRPAIRLLTVTGVGGSGKTRLAIQAAAETRDTFADGVWFVDLSPLTDCTLVVTTIMQTLGLKEQSGQTPLAQLNAYLCKKQLLLVLDNFEQVLDAALRVAELLAAAPQLKVMVTSRVVLRIRGEQEFQVPPLAHPDPQWLPPLGAMAQYAAIALFVARARDVRLEFELTAANAPAIAEICTRLDGLPLAIELAARRIRLFTPEALLKRLKSRLAILTGGPRDLPARQQTIRATIAWSYDLLDVGEQILFRRLGVFVGGCTLEAARSVCDTMDDLGIEVLEGVTGLLDKCLLQRVEGADGQSRFTMLETIREYALERLEASGEAERLRQQHAGYYLFLGEANRPKVLPQTPAQLAHLDSDYDNLWSALAWCQTLAGDPEVAIRMTRALLAFWLNRGIRREAIAAMERTLNHPLGVGRTEAHAAARHDLAQFLGFTGSYAAARIQYEEVVSLAREVGDTYRYAAALQQLGWLAGEQGDSATAWARLSESLVIFRELGYAASIAETLSKLAEVAILDEDPARAEALLTESRILEQRENHEISIIGWALNRLGHAAQLRGVYERAAQLHHESLECFQVFGDQNRGIPKAYHSLGESALGLGRLDEAGRWLAQGLRISQTLSDQAGTSWCLAGLGSVAALDEEPERAARLWGAAEGLRKAIGCRPAPAARATYERAVAAVRAYLGDEATFATAWAAGRAMPLEQAIAEALDGSTGQTREAR